MHDGSRTGDNTVYVTVLHLECPKYGRCKVVVGIGHQQTYKVCMAVRVLPLKSTN
jgi:hypothetical protein